MYKVLLYRHGDWMYTQTAGNRGISPDGKYQFLTHPDEVKEPDFVVVRNKNLPEEITFHVAPQNLILITSEPVSIIHFSQEYCAQFGCVCTSQTGISHPHVIKAPPMLPWYAGLDIIKGEMYPNFGYDELKKSPFPPKTKLLSVVTSNKAFTKGHQDRIYFVEKLKRHFGDKVDVFGRGFLDFNDKWEVLAPYQYHIVIENSTSPDYWTEKLKDPFLSGTLPFYHGCSNIGDYFPADSYIRVDIRDFERTVHTIEQAIEEREYEKRQPSLARAKELVLDDYNMFNLLARFCDTLNPALPKQDVTLRPAKEFFDGANAYNHLVKWNYYNFTYWLHRLLRRQSFINFE